MQLLIALAATAIFGGAAFFNLGTNLPKNPLHANGLLKAVEVADVHAQNKIQANINNTPEATAEPSAQPTEEPTPTPAATPTASPSSQVNFSVGVNNSHRLSIRGQGEDKEDENGEENGERVQTQSSLRVQSETKLENLGEL